MSDIETHKGKLIPVEVSGDTFEEKAEAICNAHGWELDTRYCSTWAEVFEEESYKVYHVHNGTIYKIVDTAITTDGFVEGTKNEDGSYDYFISWYNGGAGMDEVLGEAIDVANTES